MTSQLAWAGICYTKTQQDTPLPYDLSALLSRNRVLCLICILCNMQNIWFLKPQMYFIYSINRIAHISFLCFRKKTSNNLSLSLSVSSFYCTLPIWLTGISYIGVTSKVVMGRTRTNWALCCGKDLFDHNSLYVKPRRNPYDTAYKIPFFHRNGCCYILKYVSILLYFADLRHDAPNYTTYPHKFPCMRIYCWWFVCRTRETEWEHQVWVTSRYDTVLPAMVFWVVRNQIDKKSTLNVGNFVW